MKLPAPAGLAALDQADVDANRAVRRLRRGALLLALVVAVGLPIIRGVVAGQAIQTLLAVQARQLAEALSLSASVSPDSWAYENNAMLRLIGMQLVQGTVASARVVDASGAELVSNGGWNVEAFFAHKEPIYDSGVVVGQVQVQASNQPWLLAVGQAVLAALALALATYALIARVAVASIERAMRDLQAMRHEAVRAGEARTVFLATMSHEIRTPMNGVIGMTSLLRETALSDQQRHYVDVIRGSGEALVRVINEILEFTKVESGRAQLEPHVFQPEALAEEVLVLLEPLSRHKEVKLVLEAGAGASGWAQADVNRLRQVLVNLVGNALKFSERGSVCLGTERISPQRLRFVVRDDGIGMTAEQQGVIFDPFVQADASTSRRFGGTGLGLAISRRLVELMGGHIVVHSEPGLGSIFSFDILAPEAEAPVPDGAPQGMEVLLGKRVLIVDDEPVNVEIVESMARGWGMQPVPVTQADVALAQLAADPAAIDVAVLDFNMPGMDGHALARRLRELRPDLPLVLLSSKNGAVHDSGLFNARLNKPVLRSLLRETLRNVLTHSASQGLDSLSHDALGGLREDIGAPSLAALRVLVAEDNPVNAMVIASMFERLGVVCDMAGNGVEALQAVERQSYDIVLMDMLMPEMDGLEATRRIRASALPVQPWIVALTANVMSEDRARCAEAGMDEFLAKPLQLQELERCLSERAGRLRGNAR